MRILTQLFIIYLEPWNLEALDRALAKQNNQNYKHRRQTYSRWFTDCITVTGPVEHVHFHNSHEPSSSLVLFWACKRPPDCGCKYLHLQAVSQSLAPANIQGTNIGEFFDVATWQPFKWHLTILLSSLAVFPAPVKAGFVVVEGENVEEALHNVRNKARHVAVTASLQTLTKSRINRKDTKHTKPRTQIVFAQGGFASQSSFSRPRLVSWLHVIFISSGVTGSRKPQAKHLFPVQVWLSSAKKPSRGTT